jgi:hypothetical protein
MDGVAPEQQLRSQQRTIGRAKKQDFISHGILHFGVALSGRNILDDPSFGNARLREFRT